MPENQHLTINQLEHLLQAQQYGEISKLTLPIAGQPAWQALFHALGLAGSGQIQTALQQARSLLQSDLSPLSSAAALGLMGLVLEQRGQPELARSWLQQATGLDPGNSQISAAMLRCRPPEYLPLEVYSSSQQSSLFRYSPREAGQYIYSIDIVGTCNLRCPTCPVGNTGLGGRAQGFMELELFNEILDKIVQESPDPEPQIWLFNWGEPLLHPQVATFVQAINERGLKSYLSSNLNIRKGIDSLIAAAPTDLKISLSGASTETYAQTHVRGKFELVVENMHKIRDALDRHQSGTHVWVGHHIYRHNLDEIHQMADLCHKLKFDHHPIPAFYQPLEALLEIAEGKEVDAPVLDLLLEHPSKYIHRFKEHRDSRYDCELRFNQTVINYDGSVALCCGVYKPENQLGVSFMQQSFSAIEELKYQHSFCNSCYQNGLQYAPSHIHNVN